VGSSVPELWKQNRRISPKNFPEFSQKGECVMTESEPKVLKIVISPNIVFVPTLSSQSLVAVLHESILPFFLPSFLPSFLHPSLPFLHMLIQRRAWLAQNKTKQTWRKAVWQISKGKVLKENQVVLGNEQTPCFLTQSLLPISKRMNYCLFILSHNSIINEKRTLKRWAL